MEVQVSYQTVAFRYRCDACSMGEMVWQGAQILSVPAKWPSRCEACGFQADLPAKYPRTENVIGALGYPCSAAQDPLQLLEVRPERKKPGPKPRQATV